MVVKSATKKRLIYMGLSQDLAHRLATDRKISEVRNMPLNVLETYVSSRHSAMIVRLRITFDHAIHRFFKWSSTGPVFPYTERYRGLVAMANPRSSLDFRDPLAVRGSSRSIINRRGSRTILDGEEHDFDIVMSRFLEMCSMFPWFPEAYEQAMVETNNSGWYEEYYEDWVKRNSPSEYGQEAFTK